MYYVPDGTEQCGYYECIDWMDTLLSLAVTGGDYTWI